MDKTIKKTALALILLILSFSTALAQNQASVRPPIIPAGSEVGTQQFLLPHTPQGQVEEQYLGGSLLPNATRTVIAAAGACAVLFIIVGGVQMLTAYGSDEKIAKGKKTMIWAIVGLLIAILSYAIVSIISAIRLQ